MPVTRAKWRAKRSLDRLGVTLIRVAIIAHMQRSPPPSTVSRCKRRRARRVFLRVAQIWNQSFSGTNNMFRHINVRKCNDLFVCIKLWILLLLTIWKQKRPLLLFHTQHWHEPLRAALVTDVFFFGTSRSGSRIGGRKRDAWSSWAR